VLQDGTFGVILLARFFFKLFIFERKKMISILQMPTFVAYTWNIFVHAKRNKHLNIENFQIKKKVS